MAKKLQNKVGPPVEGSDFFGREREISETWSDLKDGNHLLITAPRRIGKSSLVKKLVHEARRNGWKAAYIDVQEITDEIGFFKIFIETIKSENESWFTKNKAKALESFNTLLRKIELEFKTEAGSVKFRWSGTQSAAISEELKNLLSDTDDFLIAIDELPFFLARIEKDGLGKERISDFLHWLRAHRHKTDNKIRWVFCGSIGLDTFTERHNLSESFNDILPYGIGAFDESTAIDFLLKLGEDNDLTLTSKNATDIISVIGWPLPFFLQAHFKQLSRIKSSHLSKIVTGDDIKNAYLKILDNTPALRTWEERLDLQLPHEDAAYCKSILTSICQNKKGITRKRLFDILYASIMDKDKCDAKLSFCLRLLDRDGYLICEGRYYAFRSPLLRDFWHKLKVN